jgi:DNA invertase Pin-like site-specific DNA recombinase
VAVDRQLLLTVCKKLLITARQIINTLLVKSPDRISRSRSNYQAWQRKFKKAGVSVLSLADDVNAEQQWLNGEVERMHKEVVQELRLKAVRRKWGLKGNATK